MQWRGRHGVAGLREAAAGPGHSSASTGSSVGPGTTGWSGWGWPCLKLYKEIVSIILYISS